MNEAIQIVINTTLLREIDERRLINRYARLVYENEESVESNEQIKINLNKLLDWDAFGSKGLGIYCSKFETIKRSDLEYLTNFIKNNKVEIKRIASSAIKEKKSKQIKEILDEYDEKMLKRKENVLIQGDSYTPTKSGNKAKPCVYEGRHYKSVQECMYKENLTKAEIYKYLALTNQLDKNSPLAKKYIKNDKH